MGWSRPELAATRLDVGRRQPGEDLGIEACEHGIAGRRRQDEEGGDRDPDQDRDRR